MKILLKIPTRGRPKQFFETIHSYYKLANNYKDVLCMVSVDDDDHTMNNQEIFDALKTYPNLNIKISTSYSKIHAVNRDMHGINDTWDILLLASDDMRPKVKGYDDIIRNNMKNNFLNTDGVLWFNDGYMKDRLNTLCILGKKYYERFGYIYHPDYKSVYADNEFTEVSKILKRVQYFEQTIIEHQHPDWGFGKNDAVHLANQKNVTRDQEIFEYRKRKNFYL
jgi:hypothetical protein